MIEIISTKDGSHSLRHTEFNETYHSVHGAVQESRHVFIRQGFDHVLQQGKTEIKILEVGFGTGLNALLTLQAGELNHVRVDYQTLEAFPLDESIWQQLNYAVEKEKEVFRLLHQSAWNQPIALTNTFRLHKENITLQQASLPPSFFDLVYYDAFAPEKQPDMWTLDILSKVKDIMKPGGVLVTYCAKGQLKRDLKSLGLQVESLQGPPGKREMIRASRP